MRPSGRPTMAAEAALGPGVAELRALDIDLALGGHRAEDFTAADLIVLSPGVPHTLAAAAGRARPRGPGDRARSSWPRGSSASPSWR
ncbi:MAG: hypothetical protein MZV70_20200 [Desulfobacterales bacterium]|nr:hypothetical protein [Desulfobacterales bacterium]